MGELEEVGDLRCPRCRSAASLVLRIPRLFVQAHPKSIRIYAKKEHRRRQGAQDTPNDRWDVVFELRAVFEFTEQLRCLNVILKINIPQPHEGGSQI